MEGEAFELGVGGLPGYGVGFGGQVDAVAAADSEVQGTNLFQRFAVERGDELDAVVAGGFDRGDWAVGEGTEAVERERVEVDPKNC